MAIPFLTSIVMIHMIFIVYDRLSSILYEGCFNFELQHHMFDCIFLSIFNRSVKLVLLSMTCSLVL